MRRPRVTCSPWLRIVPVLAFASQFGCGGATAESKEAANSASDAAHPLLGNRGPEFSKKTVGGESTVSFHALAGKVAIVDFWATWCEPCKKSFPKLQALNVKYRESGLELVGISEDDEKGGIRSFAADLGAQFPLLWDENKTIASKWQPKSMPSTFVVDRSGTIRFVHFGYHDGEEADIEREIKSLL